MVAGIVSLVLGLFVLLFVLWPLAIVLMVVGIDARRKERRRRST